VSAGEAVVAGESGAGAAAESDAAGEGCSCAAARKGSSARQKHESATGSAGRKAR